MSARDSLSTAAKLTYAVTKDERPEALEMLRTIELVRWFLDYAEQEAVEQARRDGASWGDIGRKLGIPRQTAHRRWNPKHPPRITPEDCPVL